MARLVIESGPESGMIFPVTRTNFIIGRGAHCDIQVADRRVSREHARIRFHRGGFVLEDLESRNGTFINHQPLIGLSRLNSGDHVAVGGTILVFELDEGDIEMDRRERGRVRFASDNSALPQVETPINWDITPMAGVVAISRELMTDPLHRLRAIYTVSDSLRGEYNLNDLLWKLMDIIWAVATPDRAIIFLSDENDVSNLQPALVRSASMTEEEIIISRGIVERSMEERVSILMADAPSDERFADNRSVKAGQIRSAMCAPLVTAGRTLGVIYLDLQDSENRAASSFTKDDLDLISGISLQGAMAIHNARLHDEMQKHQRLEKELEIARDIQSSLLPKHYPQLNGAEFSAMCLPARQVGGDYFDFLYLTDTRVAVVVGDASGKGVPAAILVSTVRAGFRAQVRALPLQNVGLMVSRLNRAVCIDGSPDDLASLFVILYDDEKHILQYTNAGHVPGLLVRTDGKISLMSSGGLLLGVIDDAEYLETEISMNPGDVIILYTDGVTETHDLRGKMFGMERLIDIARMHRHRSAEEIRDTIYRSVIEFRESNEPFDDLTIVVMKVREEP